jgi:hypothetical protein
MAPRVVSLAALVGLAVLVSAAGGERPRSTLPPPGIRANPAWLTVTTGPTTASQQLPPQVFALTAGTSPDALIPFGVFDGLEKLDAIGALIWASTISKNGPFTFKRAAWPPHLTDFRIDHGWEGQPSPRIQQRLLWVTTGPWNIDVRVYFGTQHPSRPLLASVRAELARLTAPVP